MVNNKGKPIIAGLVAVLMTLAPVTALADMAGIDVSGHQPANITCVVDYDFAVVKATQGIAFTNDKWQEQAKCVVDRQKKLGFYHYAGGGDPIAEADYFTTTITQYVRKATLTLDWESYQNTAWGNGDWVRRFVNRVHDTTGVWPLIYVQASGLNQIPADVRKNCGLWVAQYASNAQTTYQASPWNYALYGEAMRQYTSNGRLNGYTGPLDLNYFRGDGGQWDAYANPSGKTQTVTKPQTPSSSHTVTAPKPSLESLVAATLRGDYGNLPERRDRLGADYERVQAEINRRQQPAQTTPSTPATRSVIVRSGDTMSAIMQRTGLYPLSAWHVPSGNPNRIWPGQIVTYNGGGSAATGRNASLASRTVTVRTGDTLSGIAARLGISYTQITGYRSGNPNVIYPGEVLRY